MKKTLLSAFLLIHLIFITKSNAQTNYLDSGFGSNGISSTEKFDVKAICLQQDGKILVAGSTDKGTIRRFNTDGTIDTSFGNNGTVILNEILFMASVAQLPNGQVLVLGRGNVISIPMVGLGAKFVFVRLNASGSIEQTTSIGHWNGTINQSIDNPSVMKILPDGKIVVVGGFRRYNTNISMWFSGGMVSRYNPDLTLDTSFNTVGYRKMVNSGTYNCMDIYADGSIVAGTSYANGDIQLVKFTTNGLFDATFGNNGIAVINFGPVTSKIFGLSIVENNKLLISGSRTSSYQSAVLNKVLPNGTLDASYANQGVFILENDTFKDELAMQSIVLNNNKIISGLQRYNESSSNHDFGLMVTNANGTVDVSSVNQGHVITPLPGNQILQSIIQQPDGKIVAAGVDENNLILMRYTIPGILDVEPFQKITISVYPNPAVNEIKIDGLPENTIVTFYNSTGHKMLEVETDGNALIDISKFAAGVYFMKARNSTIKIIKK